MADLQNRATAEQSIVTGLGKISRRHQRELIDLMGTPPDPSRVGPDFWQRVRKDVEDQMKVLLLIIFVSSASQHGLQKDRANDLADLWAQNDAAEFGLGWVDHSESDFSDAAEDWEAEERETGKPVTKKRVKEDTDKIFGEGRVNRAAVTATTKAATAGSERGMSETEGFSERDTWYTADDAKVCPVCGPLHGEPRSAWGGAFPGGPPAHPNCRCWIEYAREKVTA